ncbi:MAG: hypothetical protein J5927_00055 [Oscillospiraceae bacterium]|nr:hypothetical protein [Oscillospiraceae bacterium]
MESNTRRNRGKKLGLLLLAALLLLQMAALVRFGLLKQSYHIDEIYSYILSNSYDADRIPADPTIQDRWLSGGELLKFTTVQPGEGFAYDRVYRNNSLDAHPPLFYYGLHTVCSLFPGVFSKWQGLGLNMALFALTQLALFGLARSVFGGKTLWAVVPAAIYGGMAAALDAVIFIRMYMLMSLFTVLLAWQHVHMGRRGLRPLDLLLCFVLTFLGTYTQYYFALFAFFQAAFFCLHLLRQKRWKSLLAYGLVMLAAVAAVFLVYPAGIGQVTGSSTNNVGNEVAGNLLHFAGWGHAVRVMGAELFKGVLLGLFQGRWLALPLAFFGLVLGLLLRRRGERETVDLDEGKLLLAAVLTLGCTFALICHISGAFLYIRYLYSLLPLIALALAMAVKLLTDALGLNARALALTAVALGGLSTAVLAYKGSCSQLYRGKYAIDQANAEMCRELPLVVVGNDQAYFATGNFMLLTACDPLYLTTPEAAERVDEILKEVDTSRGVLFLVLTDTEWSEGFDGDEVMKAMVDASRLLTDYAPSGSSDYSQFYLAS